MENEHVEDTIFSVVKIVSIGCAAEEKERLLTREELDTHEPGSYRTGAITAIINTIALTNCTGTAPRVLVFSY